MNSILMSIKPKWVEKIASGDMIDRTVIRPPQSWFYIQEVQE